MSGFYTLYLPEFINFLVLAESIHFTHREWTVNKPKVTGSVGPKAEIPVRQPSETLQLGYSVWSYFSELK